MLAYIYLLYIPIYMLKSLLCVSHTLTFHANQELWAKLIFLLIFAWRVFKVFTIFKIIDEY